MLEDWLWGSDSDWGWGSVDGDWSWASNELWGMLNKELALEDQWLGSGSSDELLVVVRGGNELLWLLNQNLLWLLNQNLTLEDDLLRGVDRNWGSDLHVGGSSDSDWSWGSDNLSEELASV